MAKPQMYSMKWNNYQNHIGGIFVQLLESETMVDLTLCAEGEKISCHRIILSACSPYFKEILTDVKQSHAVVILCGISADDVRTIVEFVYKGELNVNSERFVSIIKAAEALKITGLMEVSNHLPILQIGNTEEEVTDEVEDNSERQLLKIKQENNIYAEEAQVTELRNHLEMNSSNVESDIATSNLEQVMRYSQLGEDDGSAFMIVGDENDYQSNLSIETSNPESETKVKRKREFSKREYSEAAIAAAINDLLQGHSLLETANLHGIPRSTLYARARNYGISPRITRHEYSEESVTAAVEAVRVGSSLQSAAAMFNIPKTVLWRRVQKDIGTYALSIRAKMRQRYLPHAREAAIRALERGEKINKVSMQYKIPKTTLFREKSRLVDAGKLPRSCLNRRVPSNDRYKQLRLMQAVAACKEGKMSQSAASLIYKVSKTTIWRRLHQSGHSKTRLYNQKTDPDEDSDQIKAQLSEAYVDQEESGYVDPYEDQSYEQSYDEQGYPEQAYIILASDDCELKPGGQLVVDGVLMAENVEDVGQIIEIQESADNCGELVEIQDISSSSYQEIIELQEAPTNCTQIMKFQQTPSNCGEVIISDVVS